MSFACRGLYWKALVHGAPASGPRAPVSDRGTLGGLTQFLTQFGFRAQPLARKLLILKTRRDVRVVEGARLESVCRGNSTVGSNPTLSATYKHLISKRLTKTVIFYRELVWHSRRVYRIPPSTSPVSSAAGLTEGPRNCANSERSLEAEGTCRFPPLMAVLISSCIS